MTPDWSLLRRLFVDLSPEELRYQLVNTDFSSDVADYGHIRVIAALQHLLKQSRASHEEVRCVVCGKKFKTPLYLQEHARRRHYEAAVSVLPNTLDDSNVIAEIRATRDFLAHEIHVAVKKSIELNALVVPGESWTAIDAEITELNFSEGEDGLENM
jgi:hypothetical protein